MTSSSAMFADRSPMSTDSSVTPPVLDRLPDLPVKDGECPRRARQQLDLMLLAIEALDLSGSEAILYCAQELGLESLVGNRVNLWRLRATNPLRRAVQRQPLTLAEAKALATIVVYLAKRLTVLIRQLLLACERLEAQNLSFEHHFRLADYLERFRAHFRARMNPRRSAVTAYSTDEALNALALRLLEQLLYCSATAGLERFWISLFDGEVA
ncbi:MAG TPA: DUF3038 domain-containing protein [Coleofasciculaceae cyanobacterium]